MTTHPSELPKLGLATTHELITELMVRFEMSEFDTAISMETKGTMMLMGRNLQATLNVLPENVLSYRTVD